MRLVWVKAGRLLPVDTGGKTRSYNLLRQLALRHHVTVLTYYEGPRDAAYEAEIAKHFPHAHTIHTGFPPTRSIAGTLRYVRHLASRAPFAVENFRSSAVTRWLDTSLGDGKYDVAVCDFLSASRNFSDPLRAPTLLFQHNVESALWRRRAQHERHPVRRVVYAYEAARMRRYERAAVRRFHHVAAVSDHDREMMSAWVSRDHLTVVPTGVDLSAYAPPSEPSRASSFRVVFLGSMDWEPNVDGVEWFCRDVWPQVLAAMPEAKFQIVGRTPTRRVTALANSSVEVTGTVPSVLRYLQEADVVVVPLRVGGGTRLKIYEAMAAGCALVSTPVGAEGLAFEPGRDLLLEEDSRRFADAVIWLLRSPERRRELGAAARRLAMQFDWSVVAATFEEALAKTIHSARRLAS